MHAYDTKDLERLFGLPASAVRALTRAGNIQPVSRSGKLHYSFHDLVVLRTASALRAAKISPQRINKTLQELRSALPEGSALNRVSLTALGNRIAVREGQSLRESESGQYHLAFEIIEEKGRLHVITKQEVIAKRQAAASGRSARMAAGISAEDHYARALSLEDGNPQAAQKVYELCLRADPDHMEARINLGRLLHLAGRLVEAERVYRLGAKADPFIAFNLAVVLEDLQREPDAIAAYREALALDPQFADAHFNLARLYERAQDPKASLRHLLAYRRMMDQGA
ncbi:MAG TPA: tetratricopeptide repeat protein [Steroidobacteraceae bacterium]|jgi:tetratricopeptide (TPR) repeat protein|nr:tetratricopeptide repeat protein [Steroidobacteraceae bacterium]